MNKNLGFLFLILTQANIFVFAAEVCIFENCKCTTNIPATSYSISCTQDPGQPSNYFPKRLPNLINEKKISNLNLINYGFQVIPDESFQNLEIESLMIINNQNFVTLTKNAFKDIKSLKELTFMSSSLKSIDQDSFKWLENSLILLNFNKAIMSSDEKDLNFKNIGILKNLQRLYITSDTNLEVAKLDWFQNFPALKYLRLDNNKMINMIASTNQSPFNLIELSLKGNKLNDLLLLQNWFKSSKTSLSKLILEANSIESMKGISFFENLEWLDLNLNQISVLKEDDFKDFKKINHMQLSNNKIETIEQNVFNNLNFITYLSLSGNFISKIPKIINLSLLDNFDLSNQNGKLIKLEDNSFERKINKNSAGFVYLNLNENDISSYGNKTFCSNLYSNKLAIDISFNSMKYFAKNSNKCIFKQLNSKAFLNLYESKDIIDFREVCNCNLIKFFKLININFNGVCDDVVPSSFCDDENVKDDCSAISEFKCNKSSKNSLNYFGIILFSFFMYFLSSLY